MRAKKLLSTVAALMAVAMVATACGGGSGDDGNSKDLKIGYIAWDENIALANLFKAELDERGYNVELMQLDAGPTFQALSQGDVDLFQDAWLPATHEDYWAQVKDKVEDLGVWYDQATLNIAVPSYVEDVNSIEDLKANADMFGGEIVGIEPGAGLTRLTKDEAIPQYGLDESMKLTTSSTTAMLSSLDAAIKDKKPVVVTLWHPHWAYARYDLKDLEDPKGALGAGEEIHNLGREGFTEDFPKLAEAIKSFKMSDEQLAELENMIQEAGDGNELQAASDWADKNKDVMDEVFGSL